MTPLLMLGGAFLCYEGFEKLAHKYLSCEQDDEARHCELVAAVSNRQVDMVQFERDKVKGAIRTDFMLSAEIIAISWAQWPRPVSENRWPHFRLSPSS